MIATKFVADCEQRGQELSCPLGDQESQLRAVRLAIDESPRTDWSDAALESFSRVWSSRQGSVAVVGYDTRYAGRAAAPGSDSGFGIQAEGGFDCF